MSSTEDSNKEVRREMIEAIEQGKWEFTGRALREGLDAFREQTENPSKEAIIDYILELLQANYPWTTTEMRDPPPGTGYVLKNSHRRADGRGLYIKLRFDWPYVIVVSFHYSDHP